MDDFSDSFFNLPPTPEPKPEPKKQKSKWQTGLLIFTVWAILNALIVAIFMGRIRAALAETNAKEIIHNFSKLKEESASFLSPICFVKIGNTEPEYIMVNCRVARSQVSGTHNVLETLLAGPSSEALAVGAVSLIPAHTKLMGLTISGDAAYIKLSDEFSKSLSIREDSLAIAKEQILRTLNAYDSNINECVFLDLD